VVAVVIAFTSGGRFRARLGLRDAWGGFAGCAADDIFDRDLAVDERGDGAGDLAVELVAELVDGESVWSGDGGGLTSDADERGLAQPGLVVGAGDLPLKVAERGLPELLVAAC
jgi:hypothetical protein